MAYGQTGGGKTFTMYGTQSCPGIIPRVSEQLFRAIRNTMNQEKYDSLTDGEGDPEFQISVQMVEIYKEQFIDLLCPPPVVTGDHLVDCNNS